MSTTRPLGARLVRDSAPRDWIDVTKGAAIVLVVYFHAVIMLREIDIEAGGGRLKTVLEMFPMAAFFFIAGLYSVRLATWSLRDTWRRRIATYLYLYVLWSVIRFVFYLAVPNVAGEVGEISAQNPLGLAAILVWPSSSYWFIYGLAIYTFAAWALSRLPIWAQLSIAAVVSMLFSSQLVDTENVGWNRIGAYFVFFVAGIHLSRKAIELIPRAKWWQIAAFGAGFVLVAVAVAGLRVIHVPFLVMIGQVCAVAFGATVAAKLARLRPLGILARLGADSYRIYLIHLFVIVLGSTGLSFLFGEPTDRLLSVVLALALSVVAIAVSLLVARLTRRATWLYVPPIRRKRAPRAVTPAPSRSTTP